MTDDQGMLYLAIASSTPTAQLYQWQDSSSSFVSSQFGGSINNRGFRFFTIGNVPHLVDLPVNTRPVIYALGANGFVNTSLQVGVANGTDWETFIINGTVFLAQATGKSGNSIFKYNTTSSSFSSSNFSNSLSVADMDYFSINGTSYLACAMDTTPSSMLYQYVPAMDQWNLVESYTINGSNAVEYFTSNSDNFLIFAQPNSSQSSIRKWNGASFVANSSISMSNIQDLELFTFAGQLYLIATNSSGVSLFKWSYGIESFSSISFISISNPSYVEFMSAPDGWQYLFIGFPSTSYMYKLSLE